MGSVSPLLAEYGPAFVQALLLTWKLTALSFVSGFALGMVIVRSPVTAGEGLEPVADVVAVDDGDEPTRGPETR